MAKVSKDKDRPKKPVARPGTPGKPKPVTQGKNPQRANRQQVSQAKITSSESRKPLGPAKEGLARSAGLNKGRGAFATGRVTGTEGRPKPATPAKVTTGKGVRRPELPKLPKTQTTAKTIRAVGGNSQDAKINRLSAQARLSSGVKTGPEVRKEAAAKALRNAAMRRVAGRAGAVGTGAALFSQGRSGSALDKAVQKLPGIKANPKTDIGARASRAITSFFKKKKKK